MATLKEAASHLFMTSHWFIELRKQGVFEHKGRGGYDLDDCRRRYIEFMRAKAKGARDDSAPADELERERQRIVDDINKERARLAAEQADKVAMENRQRRGELIPVTALRDALAKVGGQMRAILESLPANCKRRIPHLRAAELAMIRQEVAKITDAVADIQLTDEDAASRH